MTYSGEAKGAFPAVGLAMDVVEVASRPESGADDDWDDTSEEPFVVVYGADEGSARLDPGAAIGPDRPRTGQDVPPVGPAAAALTAATDPGAVSGRGRQGRVEVVALLVGLLGLTTGGSALWLTADGLALEVEQIKARLAISSGPVAWQREQSKEAANNPQLSHLLAAVAQLQERIDVLEGRTGTDAWTATPAGIAAERPAAKRVEAPAFNSAWSSAPLNPDGAPAFVPSAGLAAAWIGMPGHDVLFRPCEGGHDDLCDSEARRAQ